MLSYGHFYLFQEWWIFTCFQLQLYLRTEAISFALNGFFLLFFVRLFRPRIRHNPLSVRHDSLGNVRQGLLSMSEIRGNHWDSLFADKIKGFTSEIFFTFSSIPVTIFSWKNTFLMQSCLLSFRFKLGLRKISIKCFVNNLQNVRVDRFVKANIA